ncbi:MAG: hypothetical protein LC792_19775 [Actinobacteria bacterium]|nr:hypothetical protein [Actinomycetota bacterium]
MGSDRPAGIRWSRWWRYGATAGLLATVCLGIAAEIAVRIGCFRVMDECSGFPAIAGYLAAGLLATAGIGGSAVWRSRERPLREAMKAMLAAATASSLVTTLIVNLLADPPGKPADIAGAVLLGDPFFIAFYMALSALPVVLLWQVKRRVT